MNLTYTTKVRFILVAIALLTVSCSNNSPTDSSGGQPPSKSYPTIYAPLSQERLDVLEARFLEANPQFCGGLSEFGFVDGRPCSTIGSGVSQEFVVENFADRARDFLKQNRQFTGALDSDSLTLASWGVLWRARNEITALMLVFDAQVYQGLQVMFSEIRVAIDSVAPAIITGNHFPKAVIPETIVSSKDARDGLLGQVLVWYDIGGDRRETVVDANSFCPDTTDAGTPIKTERVILPLKTERGLELRVAWRVGVSCGGSGQALWWIYVDVVSGKLLQTEQAFVS